MRTSLYLLKIAILDSAGTAVVEYKYDAWGNHSVSGSNTTLGNKNPFRYRGYYYDTETGLYYLQTRYYDPKIGRFINMDSIDYADPTYLNGLNLYAYCNNNPVMGYDPSGHFWFTALTTFFGVIVGAVSGAVDYFLNFDGNFESGEFWTNVGAGAAAGATAGFILGITKGAGIAAASYASAAAYSATCEIVDYATGGKELNAENIGNSLLTVIGDTAINGTFNYIANFSAAKAIPTNSGWFVPKKFTSYFTKTFGQRMIEQTFYAGSITNVLSMLREAIESIR